MKYGCHLKKTVARPAPRRVESVGFAGQEQLVELDPAVAGDRAVDHDLVSTSGNDQVADDELGRVEIPLHAVADDGRLRPAQERDAVRLLLRARLLDDADPDVQDDRARGERGLDRHPSDEQEDGDRDQRAVYPEIRVLPQDLPVRPAGGDVDVVTLARCPSGGGLGVGQTPCPDPAGFGGRRAGMQERVGHWTTFRGAGRERPVVR